MRRREALDRIFELSAKACQSGEWWESFATVLNTSGRGVRSKMKKAVMVLAGVTSVLVFSLASATRSPAQAPAPKTAENVFKNIQVLKNIPADQLIPSMQFISASLGVECEFCHVEGAFEKDDKKPKQSARKMMQMMFTTNRDNFEGHREITCYSCHRGTVDPLRTPVVKDEGALPTIAQRDEPQADARKVSADPIVEKYVVALGGADAIRKVTSRIEKGTATVGGRQIPVVVYAKAPDKRASVMSMPSGDSITAYDGHGGWLSNPRRPVQAMNSSEAEAARLDADLYLPVRLKEIFDELRVRRAERINDHEVTLVVGVREGKPDVKLYFDQQSGLLVRMLRYAETALGLNPTQIDYADYREQGGVKTPFRWTVARPGGRFSIQVEQVEQNVPVDDNEFVPSARAPLLPEKSAAH